MSSASTEHGASTGTWEGGPLREEPPGRVQPRPDTWLARQGCEEYLGTREPAQDSRGPTSRRVAPKFSSNQTLSVGYSRINRFRIILDQLFNDLNNPYHYDLFLSTYLKLLIYLI